MYNVFIKGDFAYNPEGGILDKTHLRFFCKKNVKELFDLTNFNIEGIYSNLHILPLKGFRYKISRITFGIFDQYLTPQYLAKVSKL